MHKPVTIVILAAGLGTRMKSRKAKVLHQAGGKTLVEHVVATALRLAPPGRVFVVVGHQAEEVRRAVSTPGIGFIEQREQKGTGHALMVGREALSGLDGLVGGLVHDCRRLGYHGHLHGQEGVGAEDRAKRIGYQHGVIGGDERSHRLRPRHPRRGWVRGGDHRAEGRHRRTTGGPRSQHGHLLLPRGSVLETRGLHPARQPGARVLPHRHGGDLQPRGPLGGSRAHRRPRRSAGHQQPPGTGRGGPAAARAETARADAGGRHHREARNGECGHGRAHRHGHGGWAVRADPGPDPDRRGMPHRRRRHRERFRVGRRGGSGPVHPDRPLERGARRPRGAVRPVAHG